MTLLTMHKNNKILIYNLFIIFINVKIMKKLNCKPKNFVTVGVVKYSVQMYINI